MENITLRRYRPEDCPVLIRLFQQTVHTVNCKDYSQNQVNAWAPQEIEISRWQRTLAEHYTVVAVCNNIIVGFGDMDDTGYFDRLFVHKDYQRQGIASKIADELEQYASNIHIQTITTEASITAKPFFLSRGYEIVTPQQKPFNGEIFLNYIMRKELKK